MEDSERGLLCRILSALNVTPKQFAKRHGFSYKKEVEPLLGVEGAGQGESQYEPIWVVLRGEVDDRIAELMVARVEMDGKLELDRKRRMKRFAKTIGGL
jgi:hypothetical protein